MSINWALLEKRLTTFSCVNRKKSNIKIDLYQSLVMFIKLTQLHALVRYSSTPAVVFANMPFALLSIVLSCYLFNLLIILKYCCQALIVSYYSMFYYYLYIVCISSILSLMAISLIKPFDSNRLNVFSVVTLWYLLY